MKVSVRGISPYSVGVVFPNVKDACVYVMERHKDFTDKLLGPLTLKNLIEYSDGYIVEKIDHSTHWMKIN